MNRQILPFLILPYILLAWSATAQKSKTFDPVVLKEAVEKDLPYLEKLYIQLHEHPELSFHEKETSARMAAELRKAGFEVTEKVGGYGVVGVLKNGAGPTVLIRADMDALPVAEETGKPYASKVTAKLAPDEVKLGVTIRSYSDELHETLRREIKRVCDGLAMASGLPEDQYPTIIPRDEYAPAAYNDPEMTRQITKTFVGIFGEDQVQQIKPVMVGEDFARYGRTEEKVPIFLYWLGAVDPVSYEAAQQEGLRLPSLHSSKFAPEPKPTIDTGVVAMSAAVLELLSGR